MSINNTQHTTEQNSDQAFNAMAQAFKVKGINPDTPTTEAIKTARSSAAIEHENKQLLIQLDALSNRLNVTQEQLASTTEIALQSEAEKIDLLQQLQKKLDAERIVFEAEKAKANEADLINVQHLNDMVDAIATTETKPPVDVSKENVMWTTIKNNPKTTIGIITGTVVVGTVIWWKFKK